MLSRLYGVLVPFFVSFLLAYIMAPLVDFVQIKCRVRNRILSVIITLLVVTGCIAGVIAIMTPIIGHEVRSAWVSIENYVAEFDINQYLSPEAQKNLYTWAENFNLENALSYPEVRDAVQTMIPKIMSWISGGLSWAAELVVVFMGILYLVFLLIDFNKIRDNWINYVPQRFRRQAATVMSDIDRNMNAYFRGQALVAALVGVLFAIGFTIIGLPMGIVMGLFIGVLNLVPYMQALGIPPCIILCLVQSAQTGRPVWLTLLCLAIVFLVVQSTQDMILTPKIMGKVTGMGPAAILLSLSIWGALFGVIGMIIALPMTTLIVSYYKHYIINNRRLEKVSTSDTKNRKKS